MVHHFYLEQGEVRAKSCLEEGRTELTKELIQVRDPKEASGSQFRISSSLAVRAIQGVD